MYLSGASHDFRSREKAVSFAKKSGRKFIIRENCEGLYDIYFLSQTMVHKHQPEFALRSGDNVLS